MKIHFECVPCLFQQALGAAQTLSLDDSLTRALLRRTAEAVRDLDWSEPAPLMGREIHRAIREVTGLADPYHEQKVRDTDAVLALLPAVQEAVDNAPDPFLAAVRFALAGNIIDFARGDAAEIDVASTVRQAAQLPVDEAAVQELEGALADAADVLFLADNAGEIVLDRPLLERIGPDRLTVVVRGGPVINDATLEDARRSGLTDRFTVITTGSDVPGIWLPDCDPDFVARFERASLVIAKGQGNYETLSELDRKVHLLFLVKCVSVSAELGLPEGTAVVR